MYVETIKTGVIFCLFFTQYDGIFTLANILQYESKIIDLSNVTDKLDDIMLYRLHLGISGIRSHNVRDDSH